MIPVRPLPLVIAILLIIAAAMIAGQVVGWGQRSVIMAVAMLFALVLLLVRGEGEETSAAPRPRAPSADLAPLTRHPELAQLFDMLPEPAMLVREGRVELANAPALALLGSQIRGQNVRSALRHAGAVARLTDEDAAHSGAPFALTGIGQPDQHWEMRIRALPGDPAKLVLLHDRTAGQAAEQMRIDFVANASHELMTPLASIKGFIETLGDDAAGGDAGVRHRFLGIMSEEAERMLALIRDLMSLSRIEAQKYDVPRARVNMAEVLTEAVGALRGGSLQRGADIVLDIAPDTPVLLADRAHMAQLVNNLVGNAMKYGRADTPIHVRCGASRSGQMLTLTVEDQGDGIAPEHLPRLTERFYRVDSGRSRALGGTGLGLSLVKHIVERHRGHLSIASTVGVGTTITILLPAAPPPSE